MTSTRPHKQKRSKTKEWISRLEKVETPDITFANDRFPIVMKSARGMYIRDVEGKRYVDFSACFGVVALGHRAPRVMTSMRRGMAHLVHGMGDVHPSVDKIRFLETLAALTPFNDPKCHLSLSGSEAVETALKTAMLVTGRSRFLAFRGGYHGLHMGAMTLSGMPHFTKGFGDWVQSRTQLMAFPFVKPASYVARQFPAAAYFEKHHELLSEGEVLTRLEDALKSGEFAALVMEVVQGRGGDRELSTSFVQSCALLCIKYNTLIVFDEVFTGFGRTGKMFALEHVGVVPDILCLGKSMAGGLPLSATVSEHFDVWGKSEGEARHTSTFLGHPLACHVGRTNVLEIKRQLPLFRKELEKIESVTERFLERCRTSNVIDDAPFALRGKGFMRGLWFFASAPGFAAWLMEELLVRGFVLLPSGERGDVLSLSPPLVATHEHFNKLYDALFEILSSLPAEKRAKALT